MIFVEMQIIIRYLQIIVHEPEVVAAETALWHWRLEGTPFPGITRQGRWYLNCFLSASFPFSLHE